jgi:CMP-N-acetylneuraminic acid synthetase
MRVLGVVTARGGSKGVPRKNIRLFGGKPLLVWTVQAAQASVLSRTILSTDDDEIANVGRAAGIEVPFMRPAELAADTTPTLPVLQHAVTALETTGDRFDAICLLQPTSPLRTAATIDSCIQMLEQTGADSVVTILPVPTEYNPHWVYFRDGNGVLRIATGEDTPIARRQALPPAFHREGSVFVTRRDVLVEQGSIYGARLVGFPVDPSRAVDIDTPEDWERAEAILRNVSR